MSSDMRWKNKERSRWEDACWDSIGWHAHTDMAIRLTLEAVECVEMPHRWRVGRARKAGAHLRTARHALSPIRQGKVPGVLIETHGEALLYEAIEVAAGAVAKHLDGSLKDDSVADDLRWAEALLRVWWKRNA